MFVDSVDSSGVLHSSMTRIYRQSYITFCKLVSAAYTTLCTFLR